MWSWGRLVDVQFLFILFYFQEKTIISTFFFLTSLCPWSEYQAVFFFHVVFVLNFQIF